MWGRDRFYIDAGKSVKYSRIFVQNRSGYQERLFRSQFCTGNDASAPDAPGNTCTSFEFHDGGFINVESLTEGRYLLYMSTRNDWVQFGAIRAFQSVNLLEFGGILLSEYNALEGFESSNLLTNFGARSQTSARKPYIGNDLKGSFNSCWRVDASSIKTGTPFSFTLKFEFEAFVT